MAYESRFYPTEEQRASLAQVFGQARYVWNWALEQRTNSYYEEGKSLTYTDTSKRLTQHKKEKEWLRNVSSVALQQKLRDLDQAFDNFFEGRTGYPNFKRKYGKQAARFASNAFTLYGKHLSVAKVLGALNVRWSRNLSESCKVTSVTLTKDPAGRYFASLTCTEEKKPLPETGSALGVDLGITGVVVTSGSFKSGNLKCLEDDRYPLKKAQRRLSRKEKDSENWKKQKRRVARVHAEIKDKRDDFLHKLSSRIVKNHDVIALETLNVKGMQQNRSLSRSISDTGWSKLVHMIEYKAEWYEKTVVKVDRWFPSTRRCHACGHVGESKPLDVREWTCLECGVVHDRDVNAAKNYVPSGWRERPMPLMTLEDTVRPEEPLSLLGVVL